MKFIKDLGKELLKEALVEFVCGFVNEVIIPTIKNKLGVGKKNVKVVKKEDKDDKQQPGDNDDKSDK